METEGRSIAPCRARRGPTRPRLETARGLTDRRRVSAWHRRKPPRDRRRWQAPPSGRAVALARRWLRCVSHACLVSRGLSEAGFSLGRAATYSSAMVPTVWVVRAGEGGALADEFEQQGCIAVGFRRAGEITGLSRPDIMAAARAGYGSGGGRVGGQLDRFKNGIRVGDIVVTPNGQTRQLLYGEVVGDYEYRDAPVMSDFHNVRGVRWLGKRDRDPLPSEVLYSLGSLLTVFVPKGQDLLRSFLLTGELPLHIDLGRVGDAPTTTTSETEETSVEEQSARNRELIARHIARIGWEETQELVAGVLRAIGYYTRVSPAGADGGLDVLASRDPLFLHPPLVKVQVKARPDTKMGSAEVRQLLGIVRPDERGIFVSTGGFTAAAEREFTSNPMVQLIGMERLVELLVTHYHGVDEATRELVPLRSVWVLAGDADADVPAV
jgi:restriction system protein